MELQKYFTDEYLEELVEWKGPPNDKYFSRTDYARAIIDAVEELLDQGEWKQ